MHIDMSEQTFRFDSHNSVRIVVGIVPDLLMKKLSADLFNQGHVPGKNSQSQNRFQIFGFQFHILKTTTLAFSAATFEETIQSKPLNSLR